MNDARSARIDAETFQRPSAGIAPGLPSQKDLRLRQIFSTGQPNISFCDTVRKHSAVGLNTNRRICSAIMSVIWMSAK